MANLLQRDETTIRRQLKRMRVKSPRRRVGRPCKLSPKMEAKVVRTAERMIQQAESEWQVTADMIRKALKLKCCLRVVSNALHRHNVYLRPDTLRGMVGNMKRRCELLHQVGGQHFEEGS